MSTAHSDTRLISARQIIILASPILILLVGGLAARVSILMFGQWAWTSTAVAYWGSLVLVVAIFSGRAGLARWFRRSQGSRLWPILAVVFGLAAAPMLLLPNLALLKGPLLVALWILYGVINGSLEEIYWRGFLFDELDWLPRWLGVAYSSIVFIAIHFVMLGAFATALFNIPFLVILTVLTLFYSAMYLSTHSLRWPVVSHILADLGNMNIFVFMSLIHLP
jgi:uncharacterized protein